MALNSMYRIIQVSVSYGRQFIKNRLVFLSIIRCDFLQTYSCSWSEDRIQKIDLKNLECTLEIVLIIIFVFKVRGKIKVLAKIDLLALKCTPEELFMGIFMFLMSKKPVYKIPRPWDQFEITTILGMCDAISKSVAIKLAELAISPYIFFVKNQSWGLKNSPIIS